MKLNVRITQSIVATVAGLLVATAAADRVEASRNPAPVRKILGTWKVKSTVQMSSCPGIRKGQSSEMSIRFSGHGYRVTARVNGKVRYRGLAQRRVPVSVKLYSRDGSDALELRAYRSRLNGTRLQVVRRGRKTCAVSSRIWSSGSVVREPVATQKNPDVVSQARLGKLRGGAPGLTAAMVTERIQRHRFLAGVESCHEEVLTKRPRTRGNVRFAITIGPGGRVITAKAKGINPSVSYCIETAMRGWRFRRLPAQAVTFRGAIRLAPVDLARKLAGLSKLSCRCKNVRCGNKVLNTFAKLLSENKHKKVSARTSQAAGRHSKRLMSCLTKAGVTAQDISRALRRATR